ncbi:MAG: YggS family pyridoxal phosphate-dependent enzyme [Sphingomicrobium sp.]
MTDPAHRLAQIRGVIARTARMARRDANDVTLIAVSKRRSAAEIEPMIAAGVSDFGENRVAEAAEKWPALKAAYPNTRLHMIGRLQSNKAGEAAMLFDTIHSLDRRSLLDALVVAGERAARFPAVYIQVNIGDEEQKGGVALSDLPAFIEAVRATPLPLIGLMAMPPRGLDAGPYFALLAKLARRHGVEGLSIGMSSDFSTAVMLGATAVRIGSALFED